MAKAIESNTIEKEYIIPLREKGRSAVSYKKTPKAVKTVKEFLARHMKIYDRDLNKVKIDRYLNEYLWFRGIKNPPHKIKVKVSREGKIVHVGLSQFPKNIKFKKEREEKKEKKADEKKKPKEEKHDETEKAEEKSTSETDKDKDGVEDKLEEKEKKKAVSEENEKIEKLQAKKEKHTAKAVSPKQEKNQKTGYNKSSRGH